MRSTVGKTSAWHALLALLLGVALVACRPSASVLPLGILPQQSAPASEAAIDTSLKGRVDFPQAMQTQANESVVVGSATLALYEPSTNLTVVVGKTDSAGNFTLSLNGYAPQTGTAYLLEAIKGLGANSGGDNAARLRTYLTWTGTGWQSLSEGGITLNALTTALALISSMDPGQAPATSLMGAVNGSVLITAPAGYDRDDILQLATSLRRYLAGDLDPVAAVSNYTPSISGLTPGAASVSTPVLIAGAGFSPLPGDNVVTFGTATASVFMASPRQLVTLVPEGATTGTVTVTTRSKPSNGFPFTVYAPPVTTTAPGLTIHFIDPPAGRPGDTITITGTGFNPVAASNTVTFTGATATPTQADANSLIVTIPPAALAGPVSVTVGGNTTNSFYLNVTGPAIAGLSPAAASQNGDLTVSGQHFGGQTTGSVVKFNGTTPQASIVNWGDHQIVVKVPGPSLATRISGPLTVTTSSGNTSQPSATSFTATASLTEGFTGSAGAGTTAYWGAGTLQPGVPVAAFTQTDFSPNSNSAGLLTSSGLRLPGGATMPVTGFTPAYYPYFGQLGVDGSSFYLNKGDVSNPALVARYSLATGAYLDSATPGNSAREVIWDKQNNCYLAADYYGDRFFRFASWGNFTPTAGPIAVPTQVSYMAANGSGYMTQGKTGHVTETCYDDWYSEYYDCSYDTYGPFGWSTAMAGTGTLVPANGSYDSFRTGAAGFVGMNEYLLTPGASLTSISALDRVSGGQLTANAVALPFAISGPGYTYSAYANYGPTIGSDGTYLYVLGKNAAYNGGAVSLFKFIYTTGANTVALAPSITSGTSVTSAIARPADSVWDSLSFNRTVPAGTTCTIDLLDGSDNVLLSNVTSGQSLSGITATSLKLRATIGTTTTDSPLLAGWTINVRKLYAVSPAYDTASNYPAFQAPAYSGAAVPGTDYTVTYSDSADGTNWGPDVADISTLTRRYVRFKVVFKTLGQTITRVVIPYSY